MKNKFGFILLTILIFILVYLGFSSIATNLNTNFVNTYLFYIIGIISIICIVGLVLSNRLKINNSKDKLFDSLVEGTDTVYVLLKSDNNEVIYLSDNVSDILGINTNEKSKNEIVYQILNIPIIKDELNNWDRDSEYVSQMVEYDSPKYNHQIWIRIKIFPYKDKDVKYFVLQISDATKEHDRQHLLISQATDIKARETKLNQITASSYDMEININLITNSYDLKYYKSDIKYFGEEKRGLYTEELKNILKFINENDRDNVQNTLSVENLKDRFDKFELDPIVIRYRIGNEVKNNSWLESTVFFLSSRQSNRISILTKNVTESAESIREQNVLLQNALNDVKMADKAKTELISTISHDIRTPLSTIMGLSENLLSKNLSSDIEEDIKNINDSSNEVLDIIDGLIDPSSIEKKLIKKNEKEYNVLKLFNELEENAKEYIRNKPIKFNLNLDKNLPIVLYGDCKRISQALNKLVENSAKYTDEGHIAVSVKGEKISDDVKLIVVIEDTGKGIEESELNAIMTSKDSIGGLGSAKKLMKILDGKLEIESKINDYTKVTVSFIQKIVEDNKIREMMNNNKKAEKFSLKGKKVLIVDDNELNLKVTSRMLEPYDLDVTLVSSGEECIDLIKEQNHFDLILLDQMMPGLDGTSTMGKLRSIKGFNIPIIVLTADVMDGQKEKYLVSGFDDYISKPVDKSELSRVLKRFLKD